MTVEEPATDRCSFPHVTGVFGEEETAGLIRSANWEVIGWWASVSV